MVWEAWAARHRAHWPVGKGAEREGGVVYAATLGPLAYPGMTGGNALYVPSQPARFLS